MTLCDAGPLVAIIDRRDAYHSPCLAALETIHEGGMVTTWPCLTEAMYFLWRAGGATAQDTLWSYLTDGSLKLYTPDPGQWERVRTLMWQYRDAPMDLADASLVAAAEQLGTNRVFTVDRHFHAYRIEGRRAFEVVP
jgi:predicted nucleic acid-binding protein